jgi:hypothetical protein
LLLRTRSPEFFRKEATMRWETPTFIELNMSAEIGSYSDDFDGI